MELGTASAIIEGRIKHYIADSLTLYKGFALKPLLQL